MNFYDVIENRSSIKKYKNSPIDGDKVARMINAAMMSPSWKNNASYKFILVSDLDEKYQLSEAIMNDTNEAKTSIKQAPMAAVVVANPNESGTIQDREYYLVDSAIAMEHFMLAGTNEGYGTCWIASIDEDKVKNVLGIPASYKVVAMTPIGESAEKATHERKKDIREHVFLNTWGNAYTENDSQFKM